MHRNVTKALLRLATDDFLYYRNNQLLWDGGGTLAWSTWNVLKKNAHIQRRGEVWSISAGGKRAAELLRKCGTTNPEV